MTDETIQFDLVFDRAVTGAALALPFTKRPQRKKWLMNLVALVAGCAFGALVIAIMRLWLGWEDAIAYLIAAVAGGWLVNAYWQLYRYRFVAQVLDRLAAVDAHEGPTKTTLGAAGITLGSPNAQSHLGWSLITAIDTVSGGTALLYGANRLVVPDACLPSGLDPANFRARIQKWQAAHG
jgi:hypothetical protein